ncbi:MHYT domain-containing protein [Prosthecomicrobium sp. N25]|uniref:MHYT domain-containing protein n=1 Tax=Prosthecomicrobium sp. N25 TaxID=3129254 RepID=UPI003078773A
MSPAGSLYGPLVLLSIAIAVVSSYTALDVAGRVRSTRGGHGTAWIAIAALALGGGIWAMHFIALLALDIAPSLRFDPLLSFASFALAVVAGAIGFAAVAMGRVHFAVVAAAGTVMGVGIAGMHLLGMAAIGYSGHIRHDQSYHAAAVLIAVLASTAALRVASLPVGVTQRVAGALILGTAISGMHYTAMAGTAFQPGQSLGPETGFDATTLAMAVAAVTVLVLFLSLVASAMDERAERIARREREALIESERRFRILVEGVTDYAIFMLSPDGKVTNWNSGARRIKGYTAEEIVGKPYEIFYTPEDRARGEPRRALESARRDGKFEAEGWRLRKDGTRFWASVVLDAIRDPEGRLVGFAKVTRDATERREAQKKLDDARQQLLMIQKLDAIGQLTGGVAHDFNNLLAVIIGNLELLKKKLPDDPKARRLLETAMKGAERGAALTSRMLSFARRQDLRPEPRDIPALVRGMADLLQRSLGPAVMIETRFPLDLPPALVDANQFELALVNLAVNARDAMPDGGTLTISAAERTIQPGTGRLGEPPAGNYVCLSVTDTGSGMDPETLAKAVEPFYTTKGVGKGTGLGLPMVDGFAAQLGGKLVLKSAPGEGTTAEIWLPADADAIRRAVTVPPERTVTQIPVATARQEKHRILVVDDDALVLMATVAMLEDLGHEVHEALSAKEALKLIESGLALDLVLTDEAMPGMTGTQLAGRLAELRPGLPVVLGTGYAELPTGSDQALPRITKPFDQATLRRVIEAALSPAGPEPARAEWPENVVQLKTGA